MKMLRVLYFNLLGGFGRISFLKWDTKEQEADIELFQAAILPLEKQLFQRNQHNCRDSPVLMNWTTLDLCRSRAVLGYLDCNGNR